MDGTPKKKEEQLCLDTCFLVSPPHTLEPLVRTLLRTLLPIKTHWKRPSRNPSYAMNLGLGGSQPHSRGEFQEKLWERFWGLSRISSGKSQPFLEGLLRNLGGSEANFWEVCFGRIPSTSKKSRPPPETSARTPPNFREVPPGVSSHEAGWKIILIFWVLSSGFLRFFSRFSVQFDKETAPKCGRELPDLQAEKKVQNPVTSLAVMVFGPEVNAPHLVHLSLLWFRHCLMGSLFMGRFRKWIMDVQALATQMSQTTC